jgi:mannitol/fructose-specific phosphotransferase system IIA component (Ntr-type)
LPVEQPIGAIILLDEAIDCSNKDDKVTLIFGFIIPEDQCQEHLSLLSAVAGVCREGNWLERINAVKEQSQLHAIMEQTTLNLTPYIDETRHS